MLRRQTLILLIGLSFLAVYQARAVEMYRNIKGVKFPLSFTVAAHEKGDENNIELFDIQCRPNRCTLKRFGLGICVKNKEGQLSSVLGGFEIATDSEFLTAELVNSTLTMTLYQATHHLLPTTMTAIFENASLTKLKSFEANELRPNNHKYQTGDAFDVGYDKVEFVPFKGNVLKTLNCPIFLPGMRQ
jgi:hypothetical protein